MKKKEAIYGIEAIKSEDGKIFYAIIAFSPEEALEKFKKEMRNRNIKTEGVQYEVAIISNWVPWNLWRKFKNLFRNW